jgi:S1-C subfamily serine protease
MTIDYPYDDPYAGYPPPPAPGPQQRAARRRGRVLLGAGLAAAVVAGGLIGGGIVAAEGSGTIAGSGSATQLVPTNPQVPGNLNPGNVNPGGTSTSAGLATSAQKQGVVTIVSVLRYQSAESAGTGMILTSNGAVLTNNHVVNGATSITVTVASTGKSYRADVVGIDPSDDVAVLRLRGASGLTTANIAGSATVSVGDAVTGVGNAGGTGTLRASHGTVTALNQSITATDDSGQNAERLTGLIQVNAPIISGDSGGPLYNSSGAVVGMDTAAASTNGLVAQTAYAIPIGKAVQIADQIESGVQTSKIHIGLPPFLGVGLDPQISQSATVTSVLPGGPAAGAGITSGSVITAVDGTRVTTPASLRTALRQYKPGERVSISWTDAGGASHSATVTLATGPAD